jgi:hypothetical protein
VTIIGTTRGLVSPVLAGHRACNAVYAGSIPVTSSKSFTAGYNQTADGEAHNLADVGSIPAPATNQRQHMFIDAVAAPAGSITGRINFEATRPDQTSL